MGVSLGSGDKRAVDVNINVVPLIDLMSCLAVFLLAVAVWTQFSQISIKPKGLGREADKLDDEEKVYASVLVAENEIWVGQTLGDIRRIGKAGAEHDWVGLKKVLDEFRQLPVFDGRADIQIAGEDRVPYQDIIRAMDQAIASCSEGDQPICFRDVGFIDPGSLRVKFRE